MVDLFSSNSIMTIGGSIATLIALFVGVHYLQSKRSEYVAEHGSGDEHDMERNATQGGSDEKDKTDDKIGAIASEPDDTDEGNDVVKELVEESEAESPKDEDPILHMNFLDEEEHILEYEKIEEKVEEDDRAAEGEHLKEAVEKQKEAKGEKKAGDKPQSLEAKSDSEADIAAAEGDASEEAQEKADKALTALTGRGIAFVATLDVFEKALEKYVLNEEKDDLMQEKDLVFIEKLEKDLGNLVSAGSIDKRTISVLKVFWGKLKKFLKIESLIKYKQLKHMRIMLKRLRKCVDVMDKIVREARTEEGIFRKKEKEAQTDVKKEFNEMKKSLKDKKKSLKALLKEAKAGKEVSESTKREISLLQSQIKTADKIVSQLKTAFRMIDKIIQKSKRVAAGIKKKDKQVRSFVKEMDKREKKLEDKDAKLEEARATIKALVPGSPHAFALSMSSHMQRYVAILKETAVMTDNFDEHMKRIISTGMEIARLTMAFERMNEAAIEGQESLESGLAALKKVLLAVTSEAGVTEKGMTRNKLDISGKEKEIDKTMEGVVNAIERRLDTLNGKINSLEEEDKKLIAEMERAAAGLGRIMALSVDRKVKIDAKYMGEAKQFSEQLKTNSKITHNAFKDQAKTQF